MGSMTGSELAGAFAGADVFVFPSRTDTFGLVIIEALACGTPVAAYPVNGPLDILTPEVGAMRANLDEAIVAALPLDRNSCSTYARRFSWQASARQFLDALAPVSRLAA
jgi:glycosyltransferase involved in cell wall biosynthesis